MTTTARATRKHDVKGNLSDEQSADNAQWLRDLGLGEKAASEHAYAQEITTLRSTRDGNDFLFVKSYYTYFAFPGCPGEKRYRRAFAVNGIVVAWKEPSEDDLDMNGGGSIDIAGENDVLGWCEGDDARAFDKAAKLILDGVEQWDGVDADPIAVWEARRKHQGFSNCRNPRGHWDKVLTDDERAAKVAEWRAENPH